jgi:AbrB family looped-hinge helix DNA binding protein
MQNWSNWWNKELILAIVRMEADSRTGMAKVTSKYQVTVPKAIADRYGMRPGDEIDWIAAGDVIRVIPAGRKAAAEDREAKLRLFDQATERHRRRPTARQTNQPRNRGWTREDLYRRGRSR